MKTHLNTKPRLPSITENGKIIGHGQQLAARRMVDVVRPVLVDNPDSRQVTRRKVFKANKAEIAAAKKQTIKTRRQKARA